ncbi:MAG: ATP-binding protein [bacterium]
MAVRQRYLEKIKPFYNNNNIKVLLGIRRGGKSSILMQIIDDLKGLNIEESRIIYINFEHNNFLFEKNSEGLNQYIKSLINNYEKFYIFFDEIGSVESWAKSVKYLSDNFYTSIFVTSSNSDLLMGEPTFLLAGRLTNFKIMPYSFREVCILKDIDNIEDIEDEFKSYICWGGMPGRFYYDEPYQIKTYLSDTIDSIIVKDVISRFKLDDINLFNKIIEYLIINSLEYFSLDKLCDELLIEYDSVSRSTICSYLGYMIKSNLINKASRYDIINKTMLKGKYKFYLTDLGFNSIKNLGIVNQTSHYLENIVFNELITSGYSVDIGVLETNEINFVATKGEEKLYIQVAYLLSDDDVRDEKFFSFSKLPNDCTKIAISMDYLDMSCYDIVHKNVIEWLVEIK